MRPPPGMNGSDRTQTASGIIPTQLRLQVIPAKRFGSDWAYLLWGW